MNGRKDAAAAREFFTQTLNLAASGKSSAYRESFLFKVRDPENMIEYWP